MCNIQNSWNIYIYVNTVHLTWMFCLHVVILYCGCVHQIVL